MKIQNEHFDEQRRFDQERYEKQKERLEKCSNYYRWKKSKVMQIIFHKIR